MYACIWLTHVHDTYLHWNERHRTLRGDAHLAHSQHCWKMYI